MIIIEKITKVIHNNRYKIIIPFTKLHRYLINIFLENKCIFNVYPFITFSLSKIRIFMNIFF